MAKRSELDRVIEGLEAEIINLQTTINRLKNARAFARASTKKTRRLAVAPPPERTPDVR